VKTVARMREKLVEYSDEGSAWPLVANILDPVLFSCFLLIIVFIIDSMVFIFKIYDIVILYVVMKLSTDLKISVNL
jgi:hypothetical protein